MRRTQRLFRPLAVLGVFAILSAGVAVVAPTAGTHPSDTASAATTPTLSVMGPSQLSADQLVRWYNSVKNRPAYNVVSINPFTNPPTVTQVPIAVLAGYFVTEGNRYGVRGDVAFAQSIVETGWFGFVNSAVNPWNNNFAGIGACDGCANGWQFPSVQIGVRAQMQLLRDYADAVVQAASLPDPPIPSLWGSTPAVAASNFNLFSHKGRAPYWSKPDCSSGCMGNGNWATAPNYSSVVTGVYNQMLTFFNLPLQSDPITDHYAALGGSGGFLGAAEGGQQDVAGGKMQVFAGGTIYWSAASGAFEVHGAIRDLYTSMGGPSSALGFPLSDESSTAAGGGSKSNSFQGGAIYWSLPTGAHVVLGAIAYVYGLMGGPGSFLGLPTTDEASTGGVGRFNDFQGGTIYWSPASGVHEVHGSIRDLYRAAGGPSSSFGFPTSDEHAVPGGRSSVFQGGEILSSPGTGTHAVRGAIAYLYGLLGGASSSLGLPTADEAGTPGDGVVSTFQGGSIVWSPSTGVHAVHGAIGDLYRSLGGPASVLGLPTSDERDVPGGRSSVFQGGEIFWSASTGAHEVHGSILDLYRFAGGPSSFLGFPITNETAAADSIGRFNVFEGGSVYWSPATGAHEVHGVIRDLWVASGAQAGPLGYPLTNEMTTSDGVGRFNIFQGGSVSWLPWYGAFRS